MEDRVRRRSGVLSTLRSVIRSYSDLVGPGGLVAYMATQDLLVITDIYSVLIISPASQYLPRHELAAISLYVSSRGELPGGQILSINRNTDPDDIRHKSLIPDKSMWVAEIVALAQFQKSAGVKSRLTLLRKLSKTRVDTTGKVSLRGRGGLIVHVSEPYYRNLLSCSEVKCFSGINGKEEEETVSWRSMPIPSKGVYFQHDNTFYGLVMPHAKTNIDNTEN